MQRFATFCLFAATLLFLGSCSNEVEPEGSPSPAAPSIELGPEMPLTQQAVGTGGGTIRVTASPLAGLEIGVAPGSYDDGRTFTVSYAPITSHTLGDRFHPISPMIIVTNGGGYADSIMTMKIPVAVPDGHFAMAFSYNEDGSLEGIPLYAIDRTSVTLWTRHFDYSTVRSGEGAGKLNRALADAPTARIVVASMSKDQIKAANVSLQFVPGADDWRFYNYGSVAAPKGHCAGQSLGMMYYFIAHRLKGEPQLYGRFDNNDLEPRTPNIQFDDVAAYRYCSMLQKHQLEFSPSLDILDIPNNDDETFLAFKFGMLLTNQPQFVVIRNDSVGHAMVVYGATPNKLLICDPNYRGVTGRTIDFNGTTFSPYYSGPDASNLGQAFPQIEYEGLSSNMNWLVAREEWKKLLDRTVGDGDFPEFIVKSRDTTTAQMSRLQEGWRTSTGRAQFGLDYAGDPVRVRAVYLPDGSELPSDGGWYQLPDGTNWIGICVEGMNGRWAGFKWFRIEGKDVPPAPKCTKQKSWETVLGPSMVTYTDSSVQGIREVRLEDPGAPEDICVDEHIHPEFDVRGNVAGLTLTANAYWGVYGRKQPLTQTGPGRAATTMEIGLKQAFGDKPGWVGLQIICTFPSRGNLNTDLNYLFSKITSAKIVFDYKEHRE